MKRGTTSYRRKIFIADSSSTTGAGLANLTHASAGLTGYYIASDMSNEAVITFVAATLGTFTSEGFVAVDNTNMPGWYEIGIPNAALDGGTEVAIQIRGATNMVPVNIYIELEDPAPDVNVYSVAGTTTTSMAGTNFEYVFNNDATSATMTLDSLNGNVQSIQADVTDVSSRIPASLTNGSMDAYVRQLHINTVNATALAADAVAEIQSGLALAADLATLASYVDTEVAAIKAKTDNLPSDPADASDIATAFSALDAKVDIIDAVVDAIIVDTVDIQSRLPAALVSGRIDASVGAMAANVLTASALATDAVTEIQSGLATDTSITAIDAKLDAIDNFIDTEVAAIKAVTDKVDTMLVLDGAVYQYTANALELGPSGGGSGSDPLENAVPGSYAVGTAGYKIGLIGANASSVYSPSEVVTKTIYQTKTTTLTFTTSEDFTGYTATLSIKHRVTGATLLTKTITVTSSTLLTASLSATDTAFADLVDDDEFGPHPYEIRLVSGSTERSLPRGIVFIYKDLS